ncbi:solute carrier family 41 member 1, partial [Trichinella spiralis]|uniref:solute carrier family 41 member 1 n=1 Tax=Trichinella spiralis TaxID=6334 RepID=UPI0001EFE831
RLQLLYADNFGLMHVASCFLGSGRIRTQRRSSEWLSPIICSIIICALCLFSGSGFIWGRSVTQFKGIAVFQPIINGIGGNLVAIQASRISTYLHKNEKLGKVASYLRGRQAANPFWVTAHHCRMGAGVVRRSRTCVLCLDHQLYECGPYDGHLCASVHIAVFLLRRCAHALEVEDESRRHCDSLFNSTGRFSRYTVTLYLLLHYEFIRRSRR